MTYTPIHNRFWSDGWVRKLNALDRYLFIYLLTNGRARLTGIYELPLDLMAAESGIDERDLRDSMLNRLEPKIYYREGWVMIINYPKHHIAGGHKFQQGVRGQFEELPHKIQDIARGYGYPMDRVSMGYPSFPDRIEEKRIEKKKEISKEISPSLEITEVQLTTEGEEKQQRIKKINDPAWKLRGKLYSMLAQETGVTPIPSIADYKRIQKALKYMGEQDVINMMQDAISSPKKRIHTVRQALTDREIDIKREELV